MNIYAKVKLAIFAPLIYTYVVTERVKYFTRTLNCQFTFGF